MITYMENKRFLFCQLEHILEEEIWTYKYNCSYEYTMLTSLLVIISSLKFHNQKLWNFRKKVVLQDAEAKTTREKI